MLPTVGFNQLIIKIIFHEMLTGQPDLGNFSVETQVILEYFKLIIKINQYNSALPADSYLEHHINDQNDKSLIKTLLPSEAP